MEPLYEYQLRLILIGDSTVGKSSLLKYFTEGCTAAESTCDATVGVDFFARLIRIAPDTTLKLQLWDTAGQEKFRSITRSYYRNAVGIVVVYDITQRRTFEHVAQWLEEAQANIGGPQPQQCVFQLVGHKSDMDAKRQVMYEEGEYFAKYHKIRFMETSAVEGTNIEEAFLQIARDIYAKVANGELQLVEGWDGVRRGMVRAQSSLSLSEGSQYYDDEQCGGYC